MTAQPLSIKIVWTALLCFPALIGQGCGDDGIGKRYAVSGKVTYKGEPVKKGNINFSPTALDGRAASGAILDGYYSLTTLNPGDGALPGTYKVTVDDRQMDLKKVQADADAQAKKLGVTYNAIPQEIQAKAAKLAKGALPGKYQLAETSDLEKEVKAQSNTINFELTD